MTDEEIREAAASIVSAIRDSPASEDELVGVVEIVLRSLLSGGYEEAAHIVEDNATTSYCEDVGDLREDLAHQIRALKVSLAAAPSTDEV